MHVHIMASKHIVNPPRSTSTKTWLQNPGHKTYIFGHESCNIWSLGCVNRKAHLAPSVRHCRTECFENEMLNKKDHSESLTWTSKTCLIYFFTLENHLIQDGNQVLRILKIIHIAETWSWVSLDFLSNYELEICIHWYLPDQVCGLILIWIKSLWDRQRPLYRPPYPPSSPTQL